MNLIKHEKISRLGSRYKFLLKYKDKEEMDKLDDKITRIEERIIEKIEEVIRIKGYEKVFEYFKMGYNLNYDKIKERMEEEDRIKEQEDIEEQKENLSRKFFKFEDDDFKVEKFDRQINWELLEWNLNKMIEEFNGYAIQYNNIIKMIRKTYPKIIIDEENKELIETIALGYYYKYSHQRWFYTKGNAIKGSIIMFNEKEYEESGTIRILIKRKIMGDDRCYYYRVKPEDILLKRDLELFKQGKEWKMRWLKYEIKFGSRGLNRVFK